VDVSDAGYASLKVWKDSDADGKTDEGEMRSLSDWGITSISTQAKSVSVLDEGNWIGLESGYQSSDGREGVVADVWLRVSEGEAMERYAAALGDALSSYGAVSGSGSGAGVEGSDASVPRGSAEVLGESAGGAGLNQAAQLGELLRTQQALLPLERSIASGLVAEQDDAKRRLQQAATTLGGVSTPFSIGS
jgi:hypothetical protein